MAERTGRLEAFSDGVFAIAVTLLVLELRIPRAGAAGSLWSALVALWPSYLAFALSFFVLLITWISHHDVMQLVHATNRRFQLANGLVLFYVTFVPFPTAVLASHLTGPGIKAAVALYCGTFVVGGIAWELLIRVTERDRLFRPDVDPRTIQHMRRAVRVALLINLSATLVALVLPWVALALNVLMRVNWLRVRYQGAPSPAELPRQEHP